MERGVVCEVPPTNLLIDEKSVLFEHRAYRGISVITPLSIRRGAGGEAERASSSFENMPFLHAEDALLEARRACSQTLFITRWFIVGYISAFSRLFPPIVRALNANIYTGSLPSERCSSSTAFTANISRDTHSLCWQKTIMNSQQYEIIIRNVYTTAQYL